MARFNRFFKISRSSFKRAFSFRRRFNSSSRWASWTSFSWRSTRCYFPIQVCNVFSLVGYLIMATQHHAVAEDPDTRLLVDIDLAILGQPAHIFDVYEQQIRQEYAWVPQEAFRQGRTRILRVFLHRSSIYATAHFRPCYEEQARINIARSLRALEQQA